MDIEKITLGIAGLALAGVAYLVVNQAPASAVASTAASSIDPLLALASMGGILGSGSSNTSPATVASNAPVLGNYTSLPATPILNPLQVSTAQPIPAVNTSTGAAQCNTCSGGGNSVMYGSAAQQSNALADSIFASLTAAQAYVQPVGAPMASPAPRFVAVNKAQPPPIYQMVPQFSGVVIPSF